MARPGTVFNPCEARETAACSILLATNHCIFFCSRGQSPTFPTKSRFIFLLAESAGYSLASYYTYLGLFVISVPGLWSLIKCSVKSKMVQKTFKGEGQRSRQAPNQIAGEILSFFTGSSFLVTDKGQTITRGQAALLTFCTCISLASVALVLTITVPDVGNNWFWITVLSPLAGA